ncbi:MAG: hypothetical protein IH848_06600 [Acidobacteria bacterium]|nr:hypothetical protein [Acidobacteriota bacterium]
MEPRIQYAKTEDGVSIAYATRGRGPPLVFLPVGWEQFSLRWKMPAYSVFIERLGAGRQLVQYDRRGFGLSDRDVDDFSLQARVSELYLVPRHVCPTVNLAEQALLVDGKDIVVSRVRARAHDLLVEAPGDS